MGNNINKYRVHEVAKDFGLPTKDIVEILTKYAAAPKNHMQALEDGELSIIFDYLTQKHPVSSIEAIFADAVQEAPKAAEQPKAAAPAQPQQPKAGDGRGSKGGSTPSGGKPNAPQGQGKQDHSCEPGPGEEGGGYPQGHQCEPREIRRAAGGHR